MDSKVFVKLIAACGIVMSQDVALSHPIDNDVATSGTIVSVDTSDSTHCNEWNAGCNNCSGFY